MLLYNVYIAANVKDMELYAFNKHSVKPQTNLLIDCLIAWLLAWLFGWLIDWFGEHYLKVSGNLS